MEVLNYCLCGCGGRTKTLFLRGHNLRINNPMKNQDTVYKNVATKRKYKNKVPYETRICACGCGRKFSCKVTSVKKYVISGHSNKNKTYEQIYNNSICAKKQRDKRGKAISKSLEGRSWDEKFGINYAVIRRIEHGNRFRKQFLGRTYEEIYGIEKANIIKQKISKNSGWKKYLNNQTLISIRTSKILSKVCQRPNNFEYKCGRILNSLFPDKFEYVGNGSVIINGRSPDFISKELKVVVLCNGIYWHLLRHNIKNTNNNKNNIEIKESKPFLKNAWDVWFIWEDAINEIKKHRKGINYGK